MIKRHEIDNMLESVNRHLDYFNSEIDKINICKGLNGYSIEPVINGNQIDSYYKKLNKKQLFNSLVIIYNLLLRSEGTLSAGTIDHQKINNTRLIKSLTADLNSQE